MNLTTNSLKWKQILVAAFAGFILGILVGAAHTHWRMQRFGERRWGSKSMVHHFSRRLNLNAEQEGKVSALLDEKREKMQALREKMRPQFEELRAKTKDDILEILTPEQQAKFEEMDARRAKRRKKVPPPSHP